MIIFYALSFLIGSVLFVQKSTLYLTSIEWLTIFAVTFFCIWFYRKYRRAVTVCAFILLGFLWSNLYSYHNIASKVTPEYLDKEVIVTGVISSLVRKYEYKSSFLFDTDKPFSSRLKLNWYGEEVPILESGGRWQLNVKLKANNGFQNEVGFDYETWLFLNKIDATGYVRSTKHSEKNRYLGASNQQILTQVRGRIQSILAPYLDLLDYGGVIYALISGHRAHIKKEHFQTFIKTNTTHLSVVSGLHIGLISGFMFLLASMLYRLCHQCCLKMPAPIFASYVGLVSALTYALIAGFSIATQRAFIMAAVVFISIILKKHYDIWQLYAVALIAVLIINPLSTLAVGFWLSFIAVALILYGIRRYQNHHKYMQTIHIQLLISIVMMPLLFWFFGAGSFISFISNFVAIPVFSLVTTPLSLLGAFFAVVHLEMLAKGVFFIANQSLAYLYVVLDFLVDFHLFEFNHYHRYYIKSLPQLLLMLILALVLFLPSGLKLRRFGFLLFLPLITVAHQTLPTGAFIATILDSGQGLAIVVRTRNHSLVFDSGLKTRSGFNIGDTIIIPYLYNNGYSHLDKVVISHDNQDHVGGLEALQNGIKINEIITSDKSKIKQANICRKGDSWLWDDVLFSFLHPDKIKLFRGKNNNSCVLKIDNGKYSILLTGDIEKQAEKYLLENQKEMLKSDILLVAHHGSNTSSTDEFIEAVSPSIAVISSGYRNRFHHPRKEVVKRYKARSIKILNTKCDGQIDLKVAENLKVSTWRKNNRRFWLRTCS